MAMDDDEIEHIYLDEEEPKPAQHQASKAHAGHAHHHTAPVENKEEYKKLGYVLLGILLVSSMLTVIRGIELQRFLADFMAVFFITFAAFKFVDIEMFAHTYRNYDLLAKYIRPWGYAFPFIEAFMGFWYLLSEGPRQLNILALIITGTASIGVFMELRRKSKFMCACLGKYIRLPLSRVSLVENLSMFAMAALMLALR